MRHRPDQAQRGTDTVMSEHSSNVVASLTVTVPNVTMSTRAWMGLTLVLMALHRTVEPRRSTTRAPTRCHRPGGPSTLSGRFRRRQKFTTCRHQTLHCVRSTRPPSTRRYRLAWPLVTIVSTTAITRSASNLSEVSWPARTASHVAFLRRSSATHVRVGCQTRWSPAGSGRGGAPASRTRVAATSW